MWSEIRLTYPKCGLLHVIRDQVNIPYVLSIVKMWSVVPYVFLIFSLHKCVIRDRIAVTLEGRREEKRINSSSPEHWKIFLTQGIIRWPWLDDGGALLHCLPPWARLRLQRSSGRLWVHWPAGAEASLCLTQTLHQGPWCDAGVPCRMPRTAAAQL